MKETIDKKVVYLEYMNRENSFRHHSYNEEMLQYDYIKKGDLRAVEEARRIFTSDTVGHLSDDPLRNWQYLFICSVTLVTRFAIEGGMAHEKAYTASDLYIKQIDKVRSKEELLDIHRDMVTYYVKQVAKAKKEQVFSKPVVLSMDYIYYHLHETISGRSLAQAAGINSSYLCTLFKKETGRTPFEYITDRRMEAAENMLIYSEYSLSEIAEILIFSSYSHFARVFRAYHNQSPKEYQRTNYRHNAIMKDIEPSR